MSAGLSPVSAAVPLPTERPQSPRPGAPAAAFAPAPPEAPKAPRPSPANPGALHLPDEQAFKVSTINQRLASLAAKSAPEGASLDIKA